MLLQNGPTTVAGRSDGLESHCFDLPQPSDYDVPNANLDRRDLCSRDAGILGPLEYFRLTRLISETINLSSVIRRKVGSQDFHGPGL